jgi:hypothetical protein
MREQYTADSGIEDAMYTIQNELGGIADLDFFTPYVATTPSMNDSAMNVRVDKVWLPEALGYPIPVPGGTDKSSELKMIGMSSTAVSAARSDDFESGDLAGGVGWSDDWAATGSAKIGSGSRAHSGVRYLKFAAADGSISRQTDLIGLAEQPQLQFYARAGSFDPGDSVVCRVSTNGTTWGTLKTWGPGDDVDEYEVVELDLSSYGGSSAFWVAFDADLSGETSAWDEFETGDFSGGAGWLGVWDTSGDCTVLSDGRQYRGSYHMRLRGNSGYAERAPDMAACDTPRLEFWARVRSFEGSDALRLRIFDGATWHDAHEWTSADSDDDYHPYDVDLSPYPHVGPGDYMIAFDAGMNSPGDYFYVDNLEIVDGSYFCVDDLVIGEQSLVYKIEVAYTDASVGAAWMDRLGVWLPRGMDYVEVVEANGITTNDPDTITSSYRGGTALEWEFDVSPINLNPGGQLPIVRDITIRLQPAIEPMGIFSWINCQEGHQSWDTSCEIYKATSEAKHTGAGTGMTVESYVVQGELNKESVASYGNYRAIGNPLLIDEDEDGLVKEYPVDPNNPGTWVTVDSVFYDGRATISDIPDDAEIAAAWVYWSAFQAAGSADEDVEFMYPKQYYGEALGAVWDGNGDDVLGTVNSPIASLPHDVSMYIYPKRHRSELLGDVFAGNGNETFATAFSPVLQAPREEYVYLSGLGQLTQGVDYEIQYANGQVKIINDAISGSVTINYGASGYDFPDPADYVIDYDNGLVRFTNDSLVGAVTINYYAESWETVSHEAYDRYGTALDPVVMDIYGNGYAYMCFADVTNLVESTGNGEFAVRGVDAAEWGAVWDQACYSGWSLIVIYESPAETAHQFYLYDPIHNPTECPFFSGQDTDIPFTLSDFHPPQGTVDGKITYFIGEGDEAHQPDSVAFKGASQPFYSDLSGSNNPVDNVCNATSTGGEKGVDIDTFDITASIGGDTEANVRFSTGTDGWFLVYTILSFKTDVMVKQEYSFTVATLTYEHSSGG